MSDANCKQRALKLEGESICERNFSEQGNPFSQIDREQNAKVNKDIQTIDRIENLMHNATVP